MDNHLAMSANGFATVRASYIAGRSLSFERNSKDKLLLYEGHPCDTNIVGLLGAFNISGSLKFY